MRQADLARRLAKRLRVPLVVTMQGELTMDATGVYQTRAMRRAWRRLLDAADAISGCSQYVLDEARSQHPGLLPSSVAIANGVHANLAPRAPSAPPYVFAVGRLVPQKGFDVLLHALAQTRLPHQLVLAGEGPERPALERLCQELGLSERVTLLGRQSHDQVLARCASAAAFVLPVVTSHRASWSLKPCRWAPLFLPQRSVGSQRQFGMASTDGSSPTGTMPPSQL